MTRQLINLLKDGETYIYDKSKVIERLWRRARGRQNDEGGMTKLKQSKYTLNNSKAAEMQSQILIGAVSKPFKKQFD